MTTDAVTADQTDLQREIVAQSNDLRLPLYADDTRDKRNALFVPSAEEQDDLTKACEQAEWNHLAFDSDEKPIWLALASLMPALGLVNADATDPNTAAFHWAKVRCLFAGAGWKMHDDIALVLSDLYPVCDLSVGESEQDWLKALQNARSVCGWPVHLGRLRWQSLVFGLAWVEKDVLPEPWHRAVCALHILKHVRVRTGGMLAIVHASVGSLIQPPESNVIALSRQTCDMVVQALGCPLAVGKAVHPLTLALRLALKIVSVDRLLSQSPLSELPGTIIAGPWAGVEPTPITPKDFVQSGLRLTGVWHASTGRVRAYTGSPMDTIMWAWNMQNPGDYAEVRNALVAVMPSTYPTDWPADIILSDFPNLDLGWATDPICARCLLEVPLFASLLRRSGEPLSREFPFVLFLPDTPTLEDSTNQGKTAITRTLVRALSPGCPTVVPPDTSSAPDNRAFVDVIAQYGTAGLDEWTQPQNKTHPLSHQNLQTMCTGGGVTFGKVMENSGLISLKHSLVAGAKAVEFPPDMVTRCLMWPLKQFTEQERDRPSVKTRIDSGQASLQLRLAALHQIETHDIQLRMSQAKPPAGTNAMRFDEHAKLVGLIYELRTGNVCTTLAQTLAEMRSRLDRHVNEASSSGVLSQQEGHGYLTIRMPDLFSGGGPEVLGLMAQEMAVSGVGTERLLGKGWNTPAQLLDALRKARGFPTLQNMLPAVTGRHARASDRQILIATSRALKAMIPPTGTWDIPETGFTLERGSDSSNTVRIKLIRSSVLNSAIQNDTWNLT